MDGKKSCSAVLCVLNEAATIRSSLSHLEKLGLEQLVVVDGGSTDGTLEILRKDPNISLLELPGEGLLRQRLAGISFARCDFVLLVDVDDEIELGEFNQNFWTIASVSDLDGVQFRIRAPGDSFWTRGWTAYMSVLTPIGKRLKLLGRPSIAKRSNFLHFSDVPRGIFGEDTWIHLHERDLDRKYLVGEGYSVRTCPEGLSANFLQFKKYGHTDSELSVGVADHIRLIAHSAFRIGLIRSSKVLWRGNFGGFLFIFLLGALRTFHHFARWSSSSLSRNETTTE